MINEKKYICMGLAIGLVLFSFGKECERVHIDDINRESNLIPDAETARRIAEAFIDSQEEYLGWAEGYEYEVEVVFDEQAYEWKVHYFIKPQEGMVVVDGGKTVWIRRDNGMITEYAWR